MNVGVFEDYGPLKIGNSYRVVSEEFDHFLLKCRGSNVHIPKTLINFRPEKVVQKLEIPEDEDEYLDYLEDFYMDGV